MSDKLILVDVDGVLLDWKNGFLQFMAIEGIVEKDNTKYHVWEWMETKDKKEMGNAIHAQCIESRHHR